MAKFRNTTGLRQVVVIGGKKRLVRDNEVLELREDFIQIGFERVPDDTPVTVRTAESRVIHDEDIDELRSQVQDLKEQISSNNSLTELEKKIQHLSEDALVLGEDAVKDVQELRDLVESLSEAVTNQAEVVKSMRENEKLVLRRMDILKTAMQAMELQMDELTGYEEEDLGN